MLRASVIGNCGSDAELKYSANGNAMLRVNVASNYRIRQQDGSWQDATEWVRVVVIGKRAETLGQYIKRGTKVYADGRLEARPWTDNSGNVRAGLELLANDIEFMSTRQDDGGQAPRASVTDERRRPQQGDDDDLESLPF
jgi:single-strand DNA-binding protein